MHSYVRGKREDCWAEIAACDWAIWVDRSGPHLESCLVCVPEVVRAVCGLVRCAAGLIFMISDIGLRTWRSPLGPALGLILQSWVVRCPRCSAPPRSGSPQVCNEARQTSLICQRTLHHHTLRLSPFARHRAQTTKIAHESDRIALNTPSIDAGPTAKSSSRSQSRNLFGQRAR